MPLHPAWVKNVSRRVLWAALEKDISRPQRLEMLQFFESKCCYCEGELTARWHADHLTAFDDGGFNHISNRVPACPRCNEQEKREMDWLEFLKKKSGTDGSAFKRRKKRIDQWVVRQRYLEPPVTDAQRKAWQTEVDTLARAIDAAWDRLKKNRL
jgi:hypothetical protein